MQIILAISEINIIKGIFMKSIETMQSYHLLELLFSNSDVSYVLEEWNQQYEAVEIKLEMAYSKVDLLKGHLIKGYFSLCGRKMKIIRMCRLLRMI